MPAIAPEQRCDATVAITTILLSEADDRFRQRFLTWLAARFLALRGSMLTEYATGMAFRDAKLFDNPVNTGATA